MDEVQLALHLGQLADKYLQDYMSLSHSRTLGVGEKGEYIRNLSQKVMQEVNQYPDYAIHFFLIQTGYKASLEVFVDFELREKVRVIMKDNIRKSFNKEKIPVSLDHLRRLYTPLPWYQRLLASVGEGDE